MIFVGEGIIFLLKLSDDINLNTSIGRWASPHNLSDVRMSAPSRIWHDRRLGGIGQVVPFAHCSNGAMFVFCRS